MSLRGIQSDEPPHNPNQSGFQSKHRWLDFADGSTNAVILNANHTTDAAGTSGGDPASRRPPAYTQHHPNPPKPTSAGFIAWYCILAVFASCLIGLGVYYVLVYYGCLKPRSRASGNENSDEDSLYVREIQSVVRTKEYYIQRNDN